MEKDPIPLVAHITPTPYTPVPETKIGKRKPGTMCFWYKEVLYVIDLEQQLVEPYDMRVHGYRSSMKELKGTLVTT